MKYQAEVFVMPKAGVLDTQGKAVEKTLRAHGHENVSEVRVGRLIHFFIEAASEGEAQKQTVAMADDLLANELIESYRIEIKS